MHPTHVVTVDGPSGAGKGTLSALLAEKLGWHLLDSGAIYRVLAVAAMHHDLPIDDESAIVPLAAGLDVSFETENNNKRIILEGEDVTDDIRTEQVGAVASQIASLARVREALLRRQRAFKDEPGLIADGRDMGTVVFPDAVVKLYLTASAQARAQRRYTQLKEKGMDVNIARLLTDIEARDERDTNRSVAPLIPAEDAIVIDSTDLDITQVFETAMEVINSKR